MLLWHILLLWSSCKKVERTGTVSQTLTILDNNSTCYIINPDGTLSAHTNAQVRPSWALYGITPFMDYERSICGNKYTFSLALDSAKFQKGEALGFILVPTNRSLRDVIADAVKDLLNTSSPLPRQDCCVLPGVIEQSLLRSEYETGKTDITIDLNSQSTIYCYIQDGYDYCCIQLGNRIGNDTKDDSGDSSNNPSNPDVRMVAGAQIQRIQKQATETETETENQEEKEAEEEKEEPCSSPSEVVDDRKELGYLVGSKPTLSPIDHSSIDSIVLNFATIWAIRQTAIREIATRTINALSKLKTDIISVPEDFIKDATSDAEKDKKLDGPQRTNLASLMIFKQERAMLYAQTQLNLVTPSSKILLDLVTECRDDINKILHLLKAISKEEDQQLIVDLQKIQLEQLDLINELEKKSSEVDNKLSEQLDLINELEEEKKEIQDLEQLESTAKKLVQQVLNLVNRFQTELLSQTEEMISQVKHWGTSQPSDNNTLQKV